MPRPHSGCWASHDGVGIVGVGDGVQDGDQRDGDRAGEVKGAGRAFEDRGGVAQVGLEVVGRRSRSLWSAGPVPGPTDDQLEPAVNVLPCGQLPWRGRRRWARKCGKPRTLPWCTHPHQPRGDDDGAPVEPVGDHAGIQAEQQPGQPLQECGHRHRQRIARLRRHQQRTGRQSDSVAEIRHPRRSQQPTETASETRWRDELGEPVYYHRPSALARVPLSRLAGRSTGLHVPAAGQPAPPAPSLRPPRQVTTQPLEQAPTRPAHHQQENHPDHQPAHPRRPRTRDAPPENRGKPRRTLTGWNCC